MKKYFHAVLALVIVISSVCSEGPGIVLSAPRTWPLSALMSVLYYSCSPDVLTEVKRSRIAVQG